MLFRTATIIASHYKIGEKIRLPPRITYASPVQETINGLLILQYSYPKQEAIDGLNMEAKSHNTSHSTYIYSQGIHQYVGGDIFPNINICSINTKHQWALIPQNSFRNKETIDGFLWGPSQNSTSKPTTVNSLTSLHSPRQQ